MPRNENTPKRGMLNSLHFDEMPRTRFLDWLNAIRVRLINGPDRESVALAMKLMKQATWANDVESAWARVQLESGMADAHPLPIFAEVPSFTFEVSGISRVITHQIVRTRLGVTYSQQGTGDQDRRNDDALVPRSLNRPEASDLLESYIKHTLNSKALYAEIIDDVKWVDDPEDLDLLMRSPQRRHSLVMARYVLPHNLAQFIYVHISLLALQGLVGKRLCTYETQEYNEVARQMVSEVRLYYPDLGAGLIADCDKPGGCHYMRAKNPAVAGSMYVPDAKHDVYEWNPEDFVYDRTRDEMMDGPPFETREYSGSWRVR